jgi:hypothetical protein
VTAAIIAQYETKLEGRGHGEPSWAAVGFPQLQQARRVGVFIPSPDRVIFNGFVDGKDGIPAEGCCSFGADASTGGCIASYHRFNYFRRISAPPRAFALSGFGPVFELVVFWPQEAGPMRAVRAYLQLISGRPRLLRPRGCDVLHDEADANALIATLSASLQFVADSRHTWTITAQDALARVCVGASAEAVKSVLYLRSAPLTAAGRKRPIVSLIRAHKRRIERGIDVDIRAHLRGVSTVEMDGFKFTVSPPLTLCEHLESQ